MPSRSAALAAVLCIAAASAPASAEPEPAEPERRDPLVLGATFGFGALGVEAFGDDRSAAAVTMSGYLGGNLTDRLSLLVLAGFAGGDYRDELGQTRGTSTELFLGAALRGWLSDRFWIQGSLDTTRLIIDPFGGTDDESRFDGGRLTGAGGYVLYQGASLDLDLQIGFSGASYGERVASATLWAALGLALPR